MWIIPERIIIVNVALYTPLCTAEATANRVECTSIE
jgi:hypothetical protein